MGSVYLLLATFFWGSTFLVQRTASLHIDAFLFNGIRFTIAGAILCICVLPFRKSYNKKTILHGMFSGLLIMLAINLQQLGVERSTAGKAGIITSLYILFVPIILKLKGNKIYFRELIFLVFSLIGFAMLSGDIDTKLQLGEILLLFSSVVFAYQVIYVGEHAKNYSTFAFASFQYLACGIACLLFTPFVSTKYIQPIISTKFEIMYACIFSVMLGYTFQVVGQKKVPTTVAAFIMSLEGPVAMILGVLILGEQHSEYQYLGAIIITASAIAASLTAKISSNINTLM